MIGFDFDGVLAELCPGEIFSKKWSQMTGPERQRRQVLLKNHYVVAKPIMTPVSSEFVVISARKADPDIYQISLGWLWFHFPGKKMTLHLLPESRSIPNVVEFKGSMIRALGITDFHEDNVKVVNGLRKTTSARIWLYQDGQLSL